MIKHSLILAPVLAFMMLVLIIGLPRQEAAAAGKTAFDFTFTDLHGEPMPLSQFQGKVLLIVNTATECGFRSQIGDLQKLHETYAERGLVVIGVPSNDFGGQEPRKGDGLKAYCEQVYGAVFPMMSVTHVKGPDAHPFYRWASDELGIAARPFWNFHKYLVGPDGKIVDWFSTPTNPTSTLVTSAIERELDRLPSARTH